MKNENSQKMNNKKRLVLFVALSFILHLTVLWHKIDFTQITKLGEKEKKEVRTRIVFRERPKKSHQIVDTIQSDDQTKPLDSRFLSKSNMKHDRQMVSKTVGKFKKAGKGDRKAVSENTQKAKEKKQVKKEVKKITKVRKKKKVSFKDLAMAHAFKPVKKVKPVKKKTLAGLGVMHGTKGIKGLGQSNDFVEDIPLGDMTKLNTIEYKYYGFYHRIKQKLEQHWGSTLKGKAEKLFRKGRRIASDSNKITSLTVTLDKMGNIVNIHVRGTSGLTELDNAAIESFNKAGPFPNPPSGMLVNGYAQIEWGFVVKG